MHINTAIYNKPIQNINPNSDDLKLREQTDSFEALILKILLDTSLNMENSLYPKEAGSEIYQSMYKDSISQSLSGSFGYSDLLFNYLKELQETLLKGDMNSLCRRYPEAHKEAEVLINKGLFSIDDIINCMVLNAPRAGDLRHIVAYYDAIVDVERTGDILYSISKRMHYLQKQHSVFPIFKTDILMLYEMAYSMIHNAVFALFHEDAEIARNIINNDEKLDEQHHICNKKLFEYQYNKGEHPYLIADILDLGRIIYGIERIGDNATNIAESAIFLTQGIDIKHRDSK